MSDYEFFKEFMEIVCDGKDEPLLTAEQIKEVVISLL